MAWFPFLVEIILVLVLVIRIIRKYISFKRTPLWVFLAATLGMGLGFALVSLMPIDIAMVRVWVLLSHAPSLSPFLEGTFSSLFVRQRPLPAFQLKLHHATYTHLRVIH
jgi:hypothetical protein